MDGEKHSTPRQNTDRKKNIFVFFYSDMDNSKGYKTILNRDKLPEKSYSWYRKQFSADIVSGSELTVVCLSYSKLGNIGLQQVIQAIILRKAAHI